MDDSQGPPSDWRHKLIAFIGLVLSGLFLLNLGAGLVEIPDVIPIIGNVDEVLASGVFFACLSQLGINLLPFYRAVQTYRGQDSRQSSRAAASESQKRLPG